MKLFLSDLVDCNAQERNRDKVKGDQTPCLLCGKGVNPDRGVPFWVHGGGAYLITTQEDADELGGSSWDLGGHFIGSDCYRRNREALEPFRMDVEQIP